MFRVKRLCTSLQSFMENRK
jgi:hypothetical protein